ncbi:hypothetical protein [Haloarcula onubensis]|uniref:Uncharacterized protein n=1 Tax=Haloarcula onubensis TaxID=2950539 RepID=A0ABU2FKG2_9EURY|nr:hypothetical protein [Halomicroarcula sp. S3CR25-11]MDS0281236.1 hypothetical protein [Halomicroarcula sp. S3CR25-11]
MTTTTRRHDEAPETLAELLDDLEGRPSLSVEADLDVDLDGHRASVVGYDDLVALDLPSVPAAVSLYRNRPVDPMDAAALLSSIGLTAELRVRGVPVARIGDEAVPGALARRLGLGPVELVPEGAVLALTRRRG